MPLASSSSGVWRRLWAEYRAKWGDHGLVWLGKFAIALEIPNLVLVVMRMLKPVSPFTGEHIEHESDFLADPPVRLFTQLAIPPSAGRLLFLAVLVGLVRAPRVRYVAADETTRLLAQHPDHPGPSADRQAYGAVDGAGHGGGSESNAGEEQSEGLALLGHPRPVQTPVKTSDIRWA